MRNVIFSALLGIFPLLCNVEQARAQNRPPDLRDARVPTTCTDKIEGLELVACDRLYRVFNSVVLAIPGWNGKCNATFGKTVDRNILNSMAADPFFDVDCFDYDSHGTVIPETQQRLYQRLRWLKGQGYTNVFILTHSTGGVVALEGWLNDQIDFENNAWRPETANTVFGSKFRLNALSVWAPPIEGVNRVGETGRQGSLICLPDSPAVLPHLSKGSDYLLGLHDKIDIYNTLISNGATTAQRR